MGIGIVSILHGFNGAVRTSIHGGGAILMLIFDVIYNIYICITVVASQLQVTADDVVCVAVHGAAYG